MGKYGQIAIQATSLAQQTKDPLESWERISKEVFKNAPASQTKSCPKSTFLGLCSEEKILDIPTGNYTRSKENKLYALKAIDLLRSNDQQFSEKELWKKVMQEVGTDEDKQYNQQMDVVITLLDAGFIIP